MRSQKSRKLGTTYFVQDANGKNLNPDLGSKNKRPDFPRLQIAKQLHLPQKGAEVKSWVPLPPSLAPPRHRSHCSQGLMQVSNSRPGDKISKLEVCSQASLLPRPCVPHRSLPQHGVWVILMLFRVTSVVRAAGEHVTAAPVTPEPSRSKNKPEESQMEFMGGKVTTQTCLTLPACCPPSPGVSPQRQGHSPCLTQHQQQA